MRFDAISSLSEICPYLGPFDRTYTLMKSLWRQTNELWESTKLELSKLITWRKTISFDIHFNNIKEFAEMPYSYFIEVCLNVMEIKSVKILSEIEYQEFLKFLETFNWLEMMRIEYLYLSLYEGRDDLLTTSNFNTYTQKKSSCLIKQFQGLNVKSIKNKLDSNNIILLQNYYKRKIRLCIAEFSHIALLKKLMILKIFILLKLLFYDEPKLWKIQF